MDELATKGFVPAAISSLFLTPSPSVSEFIQTLSASWASVTPYFSFQMSLLIEAMSACERRPSANRNEAASARRREEVRNRCVIGLQRAE